MNGDIDQYGSISLVLLLSGEKYYPDVNIARDKILSLPLYANLDLSYICTQYRRGLSLEAGQGAGMSGESPQIFSGYERVL